MHFMLVAKEWQCCVADFTQSCIASVGLDRAHTTEQTPTVHSITRKPVEKYSELEGGHSGRAELEGSQGTQAELPEIAVKSELA